MPSSSWIRASAFAAFLVAAFPATCVIAGFTPPIGLAPGSPYQLIFVTSDTITGTSADHFDYDNLAAHDAGQTFIPIANWAAVVSTPTSNAVLTAPSNGVPVYNTQGIEVAASNLYSGSWLNAVQYDQFGNSVNNEVWTGSDSLGVAGVNVAMGNPSPELDCALGNSLNPNPVGSGGGSATAGPYGLSDGAGPLTLSEPIYALSTTLLTPLPGDANGDHIVNGQDIAAIATNWLVTGRNEADLNYDGIVNGQDLAQLASNWLATLGAGGGAGRTASVPEPSSIALLAIGAIGLTAVARRSAA